MTQWDGDPEDSEGKIWTIEEFKGYYRIMREVPVRKKPAGTETVPVLTDDDYYWNPRPE